MSFSRLSSRIAIRALAGVAALGLVVIALSYSPSGSVSATHMMPCADLDGDDTISKIDAVIEAGYVLQSVPPAPAAADMNGDTSVDLFLDLFYVAGQTGTYTLCQDTPVTFKAGPPPKSSTQFGPDTDGDGCSDVEENGLDEEFGGLRDYLNPWDFYDTDGDGSIALFTDIFNAAYLFDADADTLDPPLGVGLNPEPDGYNPAMDRSGPIGADLWDMGPPDGIIDLFTDIFGVANQFGHDCTAPP